MANNKRLIYAEDALVGLQYISMFGDVNDNMIQGAMRLARSKIENAPTVDAIPVTEIEAYLQERLDEWESLGDRKWEPANMWGYNFIRACFDDLESRNEYG
jgi:hypothetical protein